MSNAGVMSIMFLYYSEEQTVKGSEVRAHTMDTNLISTGEFLMKFPSVQEHMPSSCQDEFFKVGTTNSRFKVTTSAPTPNSNCNSRNKTNRSTTWQLQACSCCGLPFSLRRPPLHACGQTAAKSCLLTATIPCQPVSMLTAVFDVLCHYMICLHTTGASVD